MDLRRLSNELVFIRLRLATLSMGFAELLIRIVAPDQQVSMLADCAGMCKSSCQRMRILWFCFYYFICFHDICQLL